MEQYGYEDLLGIVAALRADDGCPWDRAQTHESLRPCMAEEAAELIASIRILKDTGSFENMREELGDILLQVVMHSQIAAEEGYFTMADVVNEVSEKMVRRHPHVFGDAKQDSVQGVQQNWEAIKAKEKEGKSYIESPLREIPKELPSLARGIKVLRKVDKLYEPIPNDGACLDSITAAVQELSDNDTEEAFREAIVKILMSVVGISANHKFYAEQMLSDEVESVIEKYEQKNGQNG